MMTSQWNIETNIGSYHIVMDDRIGPFRAEVRIFEDVWPALGGLISRRKFWNQAKAEAHYLESIDIIQKILEG